METNAAPGDAPAVPGAVEALIAELEREHGWLADLRADLARVEARCGHLLNAADSALSALDLSRRRPFLERLRRLQIDNRRIGRPPTDGRRDSVLVFLAEKGHGTITNADVRRHLTARGHRGTSAYVGNLLYKLTHEGMLHRSGYGEYTIAHDHPRLRQLRFRLDRSAAIEEERIRRRAERRIREDSAREEQERQKALAEARARRERRREEAAATSKIERQRIAEDYPDGQPDWTKQTDENGLYDPDW